MVYISVLPVQIPGEVKDEVSLAGRKTIETVKYVSGTLLLCTVHPLYVYVTLPVVTVTLCYGQAEQIMEAIEVYKEERLKLLEYEEECKVAGKVRIRCHYCHITSSYCTIPPQSVSADTTQTSG